MSLYRHLILILFKATWYSLHVTHGHVLELFIFYVNIHAWFLFWAKIVAVFKIAV